MEWSRLLATSSNGNRSSVGEKGRSPFARDHARVIFSEPFRRLQAKTQVFPVPQDDLVHTRLTHSIEVASVGQSLGQRIGDWLAAQGLISADMVDEVAWIVATACLAHDLGNPPFGHAGEDAIGNFFQGPGAAYLAGCSPQQHTDLNYFEGNAQGFRLLTRLCMYPGRGGMRLTHAVLATFSKYPQDSRHRRSQRLGGKKFGFFADDAISFQHAATACGLDQITDGAWVRHPLASVMEAADDICYHMLDLEDGLRLHLIDPTSARDHLAELLGRPSDEVRQWDIGALRGRAIGVLVDQTVAAFIAQHDDLLAGTARAPLTDTIPAAGVLSAIADLNMRCCYRCDEVLGLEQTGYTVIGGLLAALTASAHGERNPHLIGLLGPDLPADPYQRLLAMTDFVSAMSDRQALRTYQRWAGIAL